MIRRDVVFWIGTAPLNEELHEFKTRGLTVKVVNENDFDMSVGRAFVIMGRPPDVRSATVDRAVFTKALDNGLLVYLVASNETIQSHLQELIPPCAKQGPTVDLVRSRTGTVLASEYAEVIARHDAGPSENPRLVIATSEDVALSAEQKFLVRRAFSDCSSVVLEPLSGGLSASAFLVHATLVLSEAGPRPMPFFIKLDKSEKILAELNNYDLYAAHHIPWYLRPNLDKKRCLWGATTGILVGSFVEHSESLWETILGGRGPRNIHALFENTLMGWRSQAYRYPATKRSLVDALSGVFNHERVPPETIEQAKTFGFVDEPRDLWVKLIELPDQTWRTAPMHGDMHGENVRVRNLDAIIIDLANVRTGPLCADVASLEVWVAFQVPSSPKHLPERHVWTKVVKDLFSPSNVTRPPALATTDIGVDWLRDCARQTRMVAGAICECSTEYPTAIAMNLLRRAQYPVENEEDGYRRAFAYFLGAQLVDWLSKKAKNDAWH